MTVRSVIAALCIAGTTASIACSGPPVGDDPAKRPPARTGILIPNIDDDNADGIPDAMAAPLAVGTDDDVLRVRVASRT